LNRKLLLLDFVLLIVVAYVGFQFRGEARQRKAREAATLNRRTAPVPPPPYTAPPVEPRVTPGGYLSIATNLLFDRSRNSNVPIELPPPPPPPPPMPPLPVYHGMMTLGSTGPTAFFSTGADTPHQAIHIGEPIGQFKLLSVNSDEISLEWNGQPVVKKVAELTGHGTGVVAQAGPVRTEVGPGPAPAPPPVLKGPGEMTAFGTKLCAVNDGNPEGAVQEGFKKVMHTNPFGTNCSWDPVGK
jgi:hypothetical protein